jgi:hypothetical protein
MAPAKAAALGVTGGVLLGGLSALAAAGQDNAAAAAGAFVGTAVIALAIAIGIRYAISRSNPYEDIWSPWLLLIAAGFALLPALNNLAEAGDDARSVAECREETNPQGRFASLPPGMAAETLDVETEEMLARTLGREAERLGADFYARRITRNGEEVAFALVMTTADDKGIQRDIVKGVEEGAAGKGAEVREVDLGKAENGKELTLVRADGTGFFAFGFAGCHSVLASGVDLATAREIVRKMAEAPES